ncbi:MAG: hypothetical protein V4642_06135 [Bacteroidota bacterium]
MSAHSQVVVQLRQPPPNQLRVEDFWKVTLRNPTQQTYNVYLTAIASSSINGKIVDARTKIFPLTPGMKVITPKDINPITVLERNKAYEDALRTTGAMPTGDYEICITVYNADNGSILGEECLNQTVEFISGIELQFPENNTRFISGGKTEDVTETNEKSMASGGRKKEGEKDDDIPSVTQRPILGNEVGQYGITTNQERDEAISAFKKMNGCEECTDEPVMGSFITFSWLPPTPAPRRGNVTYSLAIKEILLNQSPYDAIISNPAFYKVKNLSSPSYLYTIAARGFNSGKRYAWQVEAFLNGVKITESEINEFLFFDASKPVLKRKTNERPAKVLKNNKFSNTQSPFFLEESSAGLSANAPKAFYPQSLLHNFSLQNEPVASQSSNSPARFTGNISVYGENANRRGTSSELPSSYVNSGLTPTFALYEIPFTTKILLSTLGQPDRRDVNSYSLGFDPMAMKNFIQEKIDDESQKALGLNDSNSVENSRELEEELKEKVVNNLPAHMKFFNDIKALEVGTTHPDYTRHTMSGTAINGINVEYNPWVLYTAFAGTLSQTKMDSAAFKRNFYTGRLGLGKKETTHSIITLMHAFDDENSLTTDSLNQFSTPKENWVIGLDNKLSFFDNMLQFGAEGAISLYTRDIREPELINDAIPQILSDFFKPKMSSSADYMYSVKGSFDNEKSSTKISAEAKMIGPGFITLGNPTLRNDVMSYEARLDQKFLDNQISMGVGYRLFRDNLIGNKAATTTTNFFTGKLSLNFKGLPTLRITVMPSVQSNNKQITTTDSSKLENNTLLYNVTSGYSYKIGPLRANTMALFSSNESKTLFGLFDYLTKTAQLTQSLTFSIPLSLSASVGMLEANGAFPVKAITFNFMPSYTIGDIWQLSAGFDGAYDEGNSERTGISLISTVDLWQYFTLDMRAEKNLYSEQVNPVSNYGEFIFRATLTANW